MKQNQISSLRILFGMPWPEKGISGIIVAKLIVTALVFSWLDISKPQVMIRVD